MATARYWGDERQPNAIYAIYLRKVRYAPPNNYQGITHFRQLDPEGGAEDGTAHLEWETVKERVVKAGTVEALVHALLLPDGDMDTRHFNVFFSTYRPYATPFDVLRNLLLLFHQILTDQAESRTPQHKLKQLDAIRSVLIFWLDMFPEDFYEPPHFPTLTELAEFSASTECPALKDIPAKTHRVKAGFKTSKRLGKNMGMEKYSLTEQFESLDYILSPARHTPSDVTQMDPGHVAEQLTYWDAELFKRLIPYQCQSHFWSRRGKKGEERVGTVRATVDQFNAVSSRVMTSVVLPACKPVKRGKIISSWIDVARELRIMKNFSSLKAVLSGLQSEPVHRLKEPWGFVPNDEVFEFQQLAKVFGGDHSDSEGAKKVLHEEGTAKTVDNFLSAGGRPARRHRRAKSDMSEAQGTVPYLGSFLTDLTHLEEILPDQVDGPQDDTVLVNFEKRRKEFDVLAKLKLFQSAAKSYRISMDPKFCTWFQNLPSLPEKDCYKRSIEIEPPTTSTPDLRTQNRHHRNRSNVFSPSDLSDGDLYFSVGPTNGKPMRRSSTAPSTPGNSVFYNNFNLSEFSPKMLETPSSLFPNTPPYSRTNSSYVPSPSPLTNGKHNGSDTSSSSLPRNTSMNEHKADPGCHILKVGLEELVLSTKDDGPLYKCIKLENGDKLPALIEKALQKHLLPGSAQDYLLIQIRADGSEFVLPEGCNPYYAVVGGGEGGRLNCLLRRRTDPHNSSSLTFGFTNKKKKWRRTNLLRWSSGYL